MPRPRARPRGKAPATKGRVGHELPRPADRRRAASAGPDGGGRRHRLCRAPPGAWGDKRALGRRRPRLPPVRGPSLAPAGPSGLEHARRPVPGHGPASGRRRRAPGRRRPARPRPGDRRHCGGGIARRPGTTARGMALVAGPRPGGSVGNPAPPARFAHRRRGATSVARNRSRTCGSRSATSAAVCRPARAATAQEQCGGPRPVPSRPHDGGLKQDALNPQRRERGFDSWRFHAFFTTTHPTKRDTVAADQTHRRHAIIENVHADLKASRTTSHKSTWALGTTQPHTTDQDHTSSAGRSRCRMPRPDLTPPTAS